MTQVLADGTNTYLYGNGRIAQAGSTTEYFLGDALGSVRQLTDPAGAVTLTQSYAPYGETVSNVGSGYSAYQYTGESRDANGLTFLRARYYAPQDGRFISRDIWNGVYSSPQSLNRWNYTESNPVNFIDPSGHAPETSCSGHLRWDTNYISNKIKLSKSNSGNTYAVAGTIVQCWAQILDLGAGDDSGVGPAQISRNQALTPWGEAVNDNDGKNGYGLLCYIVERVNQRHNGEPVISLCTFCQDKTYMDERFGAGNYRQEDPHDLTELRWAVEYMRRRIKLIQNACNDRFNSIDCGDTDQYIVAALAQNGPGFGIKSMGDVPKYDPDLRTPDYKLNWKLYFPSQKKINTQTQLRRFNKVVLQLEGLGWHTPYRDTNYINDLIQGNYDE